MLFQCFHWYGAADGSLWRWLAAEAPRLAELGVTAVWLPPAFKGSRGATSEGYDVYDLYDLGEFDQRGSVRTKYGTRAEYVQAIAALHEDGMQVYVDVILNHLCGADASEKVPVKKVNPDNRTEFVSDVMTIEACTLYSYPARQGRYSAFVWDQHCFSGVDCAQGETEPGIFRILNEYGEGWQEVADHEFGNYDYLLGADIEYRNPHVREEIKRWGEWYWQQTGFDGLRLDAVKHVVPDYLNEWLDHLRQQCNGELFAVGEYWSPEKLEDMLHFIDVTDGRMSLFDACLHHNFFEAARGGREYDLRQLFDNCLLKARPELAVTLVGNHDTQPGQLLETVIDPWFQPLAYSLILLRSEGYPCVFYPDVYGAQYELDREGKQETVKLEPVPGMDRLMMARKRYAYGAQRDYFEDAGCIGWTRAGDGEHPGSGCAVVMSNGDAGHKRMEMGKPHAGKVFYNFLKQDQERVQVDAGGWGDFPCGGGEVAVWVPQ